MAEQHLTSEVVALLEKKMKKAKVADLPYHYRQRLTIAISVLEASRKLPELDENLSLPPAGLFPRWAWRWKLHRLQKEALRTVHQKLEQIETELRDSSQKEQETERQIQATKEAIKEEFRRHSRISDEIFMCLELFQSAQREFRELELRPDLAEQAKARLETLFKYHFDLLP